MGFFDGVYQSFETMTKNIFGNTNGFNTSKSFAEAQAFALSNNPDLDDNIKNLALNFFKISDTKEEYISQLNNIKDFHFTQLIIDRVMEDGLNPSVNKNLFSIKVKDSKGNKDETTSALLNQFVSENNLTKIIVDISHDILLYGEYALRIDVNSETTGEKMRGITNIHDDVNISNILPVYSGGEISHFLTIEGNKLVSKQPTEFVYFALPGNRIKIKFETAENKVLHLRMGKSLVYPVIGLLKELTFFEEIVPQKFIDGLTKTKLLGVAVPPKTKPSEAIEISRAFQKLINSTLKRSGSLKQTDTQVLDDIKSKVGEVKVIPTFGDKGSLESIDFDTDDNFEDMFEKIADIRKNILMTIGIPTSILDEEGSKGDMIKDHIRYTKKLKSIQGAIQDGLQTMMLIHLRNNGFNNYVKSDIEINFLNILNTDDLERLEYIDIMISMMDNFKSFVDDFEDNEHMELNYEDIMKFYNTNFENLTGFTIFTPKNEEDEE